MAAADTTPAPAPSTAPPYSPAIMVRRLSYIMLVRVVLFTLLLGGTVMVHFAWGRPEELGGPYISILFVFISAIYVLNILYGTMLKFTKRFDRMAQAQIALDLLASAVLVHFTGSAESGFILFFMLSPIEAAVSLSRRAALVTAGLGLALFVGTVVLGYVGVLPVLSGQRNLPWEVSPTQLAKSLVINGGAILAVSALAGYLADLLRSAASQMERQREVFADLAALHEDVVRCLSSGLLTIDRDGNVITLNAAARNLLNLDPGDLDNLTDRHLASVSPELARVTEDSDAVQRREVEIPDSEGTRYFGVSISPLTNREHLEVGKILNFQDLTRLRRMEQSIQRAEHLAGLGRVAAGVAHELRNPLAAISGSLQLLAEHQGLEGDAKKLLGIAAREIDRLDGLVSALLEYARPRVPPLRRPINLSEQIQDIVNRVGQLSNGVDNTPRLKLGQIDDGLWVEADLEHLTGVLWNLARNAHEAGEEDRLTINLHGSADEVTIEVSDKGKGIPAAELDHIFEPFYTTKTTGSGLGLAVVHRTISEHEGSIHVSSEEGHGTTFTITLPRAERPASAQPGSPSAGDSA